MTEIASALCFLSVLKPPEGMEMESYLELMEEEEKKVAEARLCRFDLSLYHRFGGWFRNDLEEPVSDPLVSAPEEPESARRAA